MISTDDDTFLFVLLFVGFKVETASDVVINKSSVPFWIFGMPALHGIVFSRCAACDFSDESDGALPLLAQVLGFLLWAKTR